MAVLGRGYPLQHLNFGELIPPVPGAVSLYMAGQSVFNQPIPTGVTGCLVTLLGGGGGGGVGTNHSGVSGGGGGAGGGYIPTAYIPQRLFGSFFSISVGLGGSGQNQDSQSFGGNGTASIFSTGKVNLIANGGAGGCIGGLYTSAAGGTCTVNGITATGYTGGAGGIPSSTSANGNPGGNGTSGSGAGGGGAGGQIKTPGAGGTAVSPGGNGGQSGGSGAVNGNNGQDGFAYGGGGGGSVGSNVSGTGWYSGKGSAGFAIVEWIPVNGLGLQQTITNFALTGARL